jgi:hypothetical protein
MEMKRFITTAAILAAMTLPVLAEGDDSSAKAGDAKNSSIKSDTSKNAEQPGGTMGRRATTGSSAVAPQQQEQLKSTSGSDNADAKGGNTGGAGGGSGSSGSSGK